MPCFNDLIHQKFIITIPSKIYRFTRKQSQPKIETDSGEELDIEEISTEDVWNNIGFHRPVAGFFYNLPFSLFSMIVGNGISGWVYSYLYPFPESMGYRTAVITLFALLFQTFDLCTANIMNRFIGENYIKNPQKMLHYIQYFCWYQMITGLIQTTALAIYAINFVPEGQMGYAVWIMLFKSIAQYPGMLNIFGGLQGTLQQYDKTAIIGFIQGEFI